MASPKVSIQKLSADVHVTTDAGMLHVQLDCPKHGDSIEDAARALSERFAMVFTKLFMTDGTLADLEKTRAEVAKLKAANAAKDTQHEAEIAALKPPVPGSVTPVDATNALEIEPPEKPKRRRGGILGGGSAED